MGFIFRFEQPANSYERVERWADYKNLPLEAALISFFSERVKDVTEDLTPDQKEMLESLAYLPDDKLRELAKKRLSAEQNSTMHRLIDRAFDYGLNPEEKEQVKRLSKEANLLMLIKAEAAVLLQARGLDISTLLEN